MGLIPDRTARYYLENAPSLVWLVGLNAFAILVGVRFYVDTMPGVSTFLWPLYADSPVAVFLMTASLLTLLPNLGARIPDAPQNRALAYLHTLAFAWLVKYGIWTVVALNLGFSSYFPDPWGYWGIILTHLGFVAEAYLVPHYGTTTRGALVAAFALLLVNDVVDYGYGLHPPLRYEPGIWLPIATVGLTVATVFAADRAFDRYRATGSVVSGT